MDVPRCFQSATREGENSFQMNVRQSSKDANQPETEEIRFLVALDNTISALDTRFQTTAKIYLHLFVICFVIL